ncbi:MAG: ssDNA-binding domain-containing protein, partial [Sulfurovum sp.]|nr:ssDNA-binding domain-containing protein [Sulfurovum sp.]
NPKNQSRANELFSEIVASLVTKIEEGENPFNFGRREPVNANTNNAYSGLNKLILSYYAALNGYKSNKWLTMKQVSMKKGKVTKGEKATPVFFFQDSYAVKAVKDGKETTIWSRKKTIDEAKAEVLAKKGVTSVISASKKMVLKHYYVFNYEQTDLIDEDLIPVPEQPMAIRQAVGEHVTLADGKTIFYSEQDDTIFGAFASFDPGSFFKVSIEATKAESRLNRELEYPEEELVKLIGSSYLLGACSLPQSKIAPELASIFVSKLKASPNSLWKYARYADQAYSMVSGWIEEMKSLRGAA